MSDILIKNMEMPKGKEIVLRINEKGEVYVYGSYPTELHKAVPVPPHGRLIDVDALEDNNITYYAIPVLSNVTDGTIREAELVIRLKDLDNAPTIIPASEEGE